MSEEDSKTPETTPDAPARKKRKYVAPMRRDAGVRVRVYASRKQHARVEAMMAVRSVVWNLVSDRMMRERDRAVAAKIAGEQVEPITPRSVLDAEMTALRNTPGREWMRALPLWSTLRCVGDACKARSLALEGLARWPHPRRWHPGGPGTVAVAYDERGRCPKYRAARALPLKGLGVLRLRTGRGYMPERIVGHPAVTVRRDCTGKLSAAFASPSEELPERKVKRVLGEGPIPDPVGLDGGVLVLATLSDGTVVRSICAQRALERQARAKGAPARARKEREKKVANAAQASAAGKKQNTKGVETPGEASARKKRRRASKHLRRAKRYAEGGEIAAQRAVKKAEKAKRQAQARACRAQALREKADAQRAEEARAGSANAHNAGETDPPKAKHRHKGKGSGVGRRHAKKRTPEQTKRRRLNRRLSRRVEGSQNREHARMDLARFEAGLANHAHDYVEQLTCLLVNVYAWLFIETLDVRALAQGWCGKAVLDARLGLFIKRLKEKAWRTGTCIVQVGKWFPSSKRCHQCGAVNKELTLGERQWTCPACSTLLERDDNGSVNLLFEGLRLHVENGELGPDDARRIAEKAKAARATTHSPGMPPMPARQPIGQRTRRWRETATWEHVQTPVERSQRRSRGSSPAVRRIAPGNRKQFASSPNGPSMELGP